VENGTRINARRTVEKSDVVADWGENRRRKT